MLDNYLDDLAGKAANSPPLKEWKKWRNHPVTQWLQVVLEYEHTRIMNSKPMSDATFKEAGMWALTRTAVLEEITYISAEMEGPDEPEDEEEDNV